MKGMTSCRPPEKSNESEIKSNESEMDLINRRDAIDAVKNAIVTVLYHDTEPVDEAMEEAIEATKRSAEASIEGLPSAQPDLSGYSDRLWRAAYERGKAEAQAEIIHCGDCKYWHGARMLDGHDRCEVYSLITYENFFCASAERRTDETD